MTVKGRIRNGAIVLDEPISLPDGTEVRIDLGDAAHPAELADPEIPSLYDQFREYIGVVEGLPSDFAERHDHYIHGTGR